MLPSSKQRLARVLCVGGGLLFAGGLYALLCIWLGFGIPCPFHTATGLLCPGCGVSRMCLRLLRLDFVGAWQANPMLLLLLPPGAILTLRGVVRYVRTGSRALDRLENISLWTACGLLVCFGILRNL